MLGAGSVAIANAVSGGSSHRLGDTTAKSAVAQGLDVPTVTPRLPAPAPAPTPSSARPRDEPVVPHRVPPALRINDVHGPCYVQVTRHGSLLKRTILRQGQQLTFRRHGLDVVLGNAGAVRLRINGHHPIRPGASGQVRNVHVR
jgi:hypothetical protein